MEFWSARGSLNDNAAQQQLDGLQKQLDGPLPMRTITVAGSAAIDPSARLIRYVGSGGDTLTLPTAKAQGDGMGQLLVVANTGAAAISVVPSGSDTLNRVGTAYSVPAGVLVVFAADAQGGWWAESPAQAGSVQRSTWLTGTSLASVAGCKRARVWIRAGGGGAGGANAAVDGGGGGAAGGWAYFETTHIPTTWNFTIGAGGAGGNGAISTIGTAGGDSTFSDGVTTVTAHGGPGGDVGGVPGDAPALSTNGTKNGSGEPGGAGVPGSSIGGNGGSSDWGGGGTGARAGLAGNNAVGPGSGGGGASRVGGGQTNGGAGTAGATFLEELT